MTYIQNWKSKEKHQFLRNNLNRRTCVCKTGIMVPYIRVYTCMINIWHWHVYLHKCVCMHAHKRVECYTSTTPFLPYKFISPCFNLGLDTRGHCVYLYQDVCACMYGWVCVVCCPASWLIITDSKNSLFVCALVFVVSRMVACFCPAFNSFYGAASRTVQMPGSSI